MGFDVVVVLAQGAEVAGAGGSVGPGDGVVGLAVSGWSPAVGEHAGGVAQGDGTPARCSTPSSWASSSSRVSRRWASMVSKVPAISAWSSVVWSIQTSRLGPHLLGPVGEHLGLHLGGDGVDDAFQLGPAQPGQQPQYRVLHCCGRLGGQVAGAGGDQPGGGQVADPGPHRGPEAGHPHGQVYRVGQEPGSRPGGDPGRGPPFGGRVGPARGGELTAQVHPFLAARRQRLARAARR